MDLPAIPDDVPALPAPSTMPREDATMSLHVVSPPLPQLLNLATTKTLADTLLLHPNTRREAIERDRRVTFFRGREVRKCFRDYDRNYTIDDIGHSLMTHGFIHKSRRIKAALASHHAKTPVSPYPHLDIDESNQTFTEDGVYTWMYEGSSTVRYLMSLSFFALLCMGVLYPVWPAWGQKMLWDSGVTVALAIAVMLVVRFVAWLVVWLATGHHMWVLPQFPVLQPTYAMRSANTSTGKASWIPRAAVALTLVALAFTMWTYPPACASAKKGCVGVGRRLIKQAYRGTLLQRFSQEEKDFAMTVFRILRRLF